MEHLPSRLRSQWMPFTTAEILYCLTPTTHLDIILQQGLEPHFDYYDDIKVVVLAYSRDPSYEPTHRSVLAGLHSDGIEMVRLHICTANQLYRSLDINRSFEVLSLDPVNSGDIVKIEKL